MAFVPKRTKDKEPAGYKSLYIKEKLIKEKTGKDLVYRRFLDPHIVTAEELDRRAEKSIGKTGKMFKKISPNNFQNQAKRLLRRRK